MIPALEMGGHGADHPEGDARVMLAQFSTYSLVYLPRPTVVILGVPPEYLQGNRLQPNQERGYYRDISPCTVLMTRAVLGT